MITRWWLVLLAVGLAAGLTGCETRDEARFGRVGDPRMATAVPAPRAALLFDRVPGPYRASDFAYRSDWPSTNAFYSPGQVIYYSERFVDYQGRNYHDHDDFYRRSESIRIGVGYR